MYANLPLRKRVTNTLYLTLFIYRIGYPAGIEAGTAI
jgi:hypothetical protein